MGWLRADQMQPELAKVAAGLRQGELSQPIQASGGYYLLLVLERRAGTGGASASAASAGGELDMVYDIVQVVFPLPARSGEAARQTAISEAESVRTAAKDCPTLLKIGKEKAPQLSSEGKLQASAIAPEMRNVIGKLAIGEASRPIVQKNGVGVIMVCGKSAVGRRHSRDAAGDYRDADKAAARYHRAALPEGFAAQLLCRRQGVRRTTTIPLALTMGEPAGIGGEITLKAWLRRGEGVPPFYVIDDPDRLAALARRLGLGRADTRSRRPPRRRRRPSRRALPVLPVGGKVRAAPGQPDPRRRAARDRRDLPRGRRCAERRAPPRS